MQLEGLEFEISFQVTNKYLEIADVEGGSFMGPGKQQERSKTHRDAKLCSTTVDNTRNQNKLTFSSLSSFSSSGSKLNSTYFIILVLAMITVNNANIHSIRYE